MQAIQNIHPSAQIRPATTTLAKITAKEDCARTLGINHNHVLELKAKAATLNLSHESVVILILNTDDPNGNKMASLVSNHEPRLSYGIADRSWAAGALMSFDLRALSSLNKTTSLAVIAVDRGVAIVREA